MIKKWKKMSETDRGKAKALIGFGIIGLYMPLFMMSRGRHLEADKMLNRKMNRLETRTKVDNLGGGLNSRTVKSKIKKVEDKIKELNAQFDNLDGGFAPLNSAEKQQELNLEISTLAERTGVDLISVVKKGSNLKEQKKVYLDKITARPLLKIEARARFGALDNFLKELKGLPFFVSVMNVKIYAERPDGEKDDGQENDGKLFIYLEVSV